MMSIYGTLSLVISSGAMPGTVSRSLSYELRSTTVSNISANREINHYDITLIKIIENC